MTEVAPMSETRTLSGADYRALQPTKQLRNFLCDIERRKA